MSNQFNVKRAKLDLDKGLMPFNIFDYDTNMVNLLYHHKATSPLWCKFLKDVFKRDDIANYVQKLVGYCLSGDTSEQKMFFFYGNGSNGKSTFLNIIQAIMGPYTKTMPGDSFTSINQGRINNDIARLVGIRMVVASEYNKDSLMDTALVKRLTGSDMITARFLHQEFFEFKPQFKIIIPTNHIFKINQDDYGLTRRIVIVPFEEQFKEKKDPDIEDKLKCELDGVLAWAVQGYHLWKKEGLIEPDYMKNYYKKIPGMQNIDIKEFLDKTTIKTSGDRVPFKKLYELYIDTDENNISKKAFSKKLNELGYETQKSTGGDIFIKSIAFNKDNAI